MSGLQQRRMRRCSQAIMIAWRAAHGSGGSAPRRQSLTLVAPSRGDPLGTCWAALFYGAPAKTVYHYCGIVTDRDHPKRFSLSEMACTAVRLAEARTQGDGAGGSAQRGTSGAATGPGGRSPLPRKNLT